MTRKRQFVDDLIDEWVMLPVWINHSVMSHMFWGEKKKTLTQLKIQMSRERQIVDDLIDE